MSRARGRRRASAILLTVLGPVVLVGCANAASFATELAGCKAGEGGTPTNGVILMAQSVPTASWVPCVNELPPGWHFTDLKARNGSAQFFLDYELNVTDDDEIGPHAIEVSLTESCDTEGASPVPSDREGIDRLERLTQVSPTYVSRRFYVFEGGCVTVVFTIVGKDRSGPLAVATQAIGTVPRDDLRDLVREQSGGRLELDPPGSEEP